MRKVSVFSTVITFLIVISACSPGGATSQPPAGENGLKILAVESFLADITRNVAGERATVDALIPLGLDPHAFEPTPKDVGRIADSDIFVVNGGGVEEWLTEILENAGGQQRLIVASEGLTPREPSAMEPAHDEESANEPHGENDSEHATDPHFWFDPVLVIKYVENIRDGLIEADPGGKEIYTKNAKAYITSLEQLNAWALEQMKQIPADDRLMVTNHESFGYFADRYGLKIVGAVLPSVSTNASPSAKQVAGLVEAIRSTGAKAIFLETGSNPEMAQQIAEETGAKVVTGLYSHSLSEAGGPAPTYIEMMRYNITLIVSALK